MPQVFANGARVELDTSISAEDISLNVISGGDLFPIANYEGVGTLPQTSPEDWFKLVIQDDDGYEVVYCYSHTVGSNIFNNLRRGMDGTTARAFSTGAVVGIRPLAKDMGDLVARTKANSDLLETKADKTGNIQGNAATATKLESPRALSISGGVTAAAKNFDGTMPVDLEVTAIDVSKVNQGTLPVVRGGTGTTTSTGSGSVVLSTSPELSGTPTAPTAAPGTNTTQLATTGFVQAGLNGKSDTDHTHSTATADANGFMSSSDKTKLDGIEVGANKFSLPNGTNGQVLKHNGTEWVAGTDNNTTYSVATSSANGLMASADKTKLDGIETGANNFSLPAGTNGQVLKHNGTAWVAGTDNNTTYSTMSASEANAGTSTTAQVITAAVLKGAITTHAPTPTSVSGNAGTATKLETARTINGVPFDGTTNITIKDTAAGWGIVNGVNQFNITTLPDANNENLWVAGQCRYSTPDIPGSYGSLLRMGGGTSGINGGWFQDIAISTGGNMYIRQKTNEGPWSSFRQVAFTDEFLRLTGGSLSGNLSVSGSITASGNITAYSDIRLKTNLVEIGDALSKVKQLTGYTYTRIDTGERQTGLVAQDVQKILPEAVQENEDGTLSVAYGNLVGLLVNAVKELNAKVEALEKGK